MKTTKGHDDDDDEIHAPPWCPQGPQSLHLLPISSGLKNWVHTDLEKTRKSRKKDKMISLQGKTHLVGTTLAADIFPRSHNRSPNVTQVIHFYHV